MPIQPRSPRRRLKSAARCEPKSLFGVQRPAASSSAIKSRTSRRSASHSGGNATGSKRNGVLIAEPYRAAPLAANAGLIRPASVHPEPLLGAVADPRLQGCIDLGHQRRGVGMRIAAARQWQRRRNSDPEARAFEPLDPQRQHGTIETERQNREGGSGHRRAAKERHRDAVIHLLVRQQTQMRATTQRRDRLPRGYRALWNEFALIAAEPRNHAVHQRVVGGSVDLGNRDPMLGAGKHADLPIGDMSGEDDHPATGGDRPIDMLEAMRLNPPSRLENADSAQMRIFGGNAAEIIPHGDDNPPDLGLGKLGESAAEVAPGKFGNTEKRPNVARQRTTEGG